MALVMNQCVGLVCVLGLCCDAAPLLRLDALYMSGWLLCGGSFVGNILQCADL